MLKYSLIGKQEFFDELEKHYDKVVEFNAECLLIDDFDNFVDETVRDFIDGKNFEFKYQAFLLDYYEPELNEYMITHGFNSVNELFEEVLYNICYDYLIEKYERGV
jgi:hypothetical protein